MTKINKEGWEIKKLGEIISSAKNLRCGEGQYEVLSMTMHDGIVLQRDRFKKSLASEDKSNYKVVKRGQLVVGFPIDEGVLYIQKVIDEGIMSPAYNVWDITSTEIDKTFLELALHSPHSMSYYKNKLRGSTARRRTLPTSTLLALPIPLPPLPIQRRIVDELDEINAIISAKKQQLSKLDELAQSIFYNMFGDPVANEKGWEVKTLKELTTKLGSGATPRGGNQAYKEEGVSLIRSLNVHNNEFIYKDLAHIDDEQAKALNGVTIEEDDILLNITGASVARSCIVPKEVLPARVNQHVCIIRPKDIVVSYLARLLTSTPYQVHLIALATSKAATREALPKNLVEGLKIILPPLPLQETFAARVSAIEEEKAAIAASIEKMQTLLDARMQEYFG